MSLNCKEHPATKQKGSNLTSFKNCNQPTKFRSLTARSIQLSSEKVSEIAELQKIGVNHLQIRSKEHLEFFS